MVGISLKGGCGKLESLKRLHHVFIFELKGRKRLLGILTIFDRTIQLLFELVRGRSAK